MAGFLQSILAAEEPMFSAGLTKLEKSTGDSGIDTKLIAEITEKAHSIMRHLQLDTSDTTAKELYLSLMSAAKREHIESMLGGYEYVLFPIGGCTISFNPVDVVENSHHNLPYEQRIISNGQRNLRNELVRRYVEHPRSDEMTTVETATFIGLLPDSDAWYTDVKYLPKQKTNHEKEPIE